MTETVALMRKGLGAPPLAGFDARALLPQVEHRDYVPLRDVSQWLGWTQTGQKYAIREGLLEAERIPHAPGRPYRITGEEACTLLLAAALALAAGLAITVMLRGVKGAGLTGEAAAAVIRSMPA